MARIARKTSSSNIYHIILRGVNHRIIFEEDSDYRQFLFTLQYYIELCNYEIFAYCLMTNHIHILMHFPDNNLSDSMKKIEDKFIWWYNKKHQRTGHLFQDRFKSEPVESQRYLEKVFRYIHQNPLKAGLVKDLRQYKWSSFHEYANRKKELVKIEYMGDLLGGMDSLITYITEPSKDICICMEYTRIKITDSETIELIKQHTNIMSLNELQNVDSYILKDLFTYLKENGISYRQLSRVTGFSRDTISKICKTRPQGDIRDSH